MGGRAPDRLSRLEMLGAWLRLWTPPREAVVPPVPWGKAAVGACLVAAAATVAVVLLLNAEADRRDARERAVRAAAARHAAFLATVDREQSPRRGRGPAGTAHAVSPADRRGARRALLATARARLKADARERSGKPVAGVECEPFPKRLDATPPDADLSRRAAAYDCIAVSSRFESGVIGMPFRLVVHFDSGRLAWCRIVPLGDRDRLGHPLPAACRL